MHGIEALHRELAPFGNRIRFNEDDSSA